MGKYNKLPIITIDKFEDEAWQETEAIANELKNTIALRNQKKVIITLDCYHGVYIEDVVKRLSEHLNINYKFNVADANHSEEYINEMLTNNITDDRVFGFISNHSIDDFFDDQKIDDMVSNINVIKEGIILVYGIGASYVIKGDILVFADMARWEIQMRMRNKSITNWCSTDFELDFIRKYKRAYFIDWRVLDRHKQFIWDSVDYFLDTNDTQIDKMLTSRAVKKALQTTVNRPFRVVPFFDPGPWGGQWMKEVCDLDKSKPNYAWCFDCVPEENSVLFEFNNIVFEMPSINLVFTHPEELLGEKVYKRFGKEFPIRFDFLDTMEGGNLSLQVHPTKEYIRNTFGMEYTQDESYYILDAKEDVKVYLGIKENIDSDDMINELKSAQQGESAFDTDKYVNSFSAKKHDHFLIPAGTVHCSGKDVMVLEISATPYIFTFKLWDWGRLGLDGLPRPIHLEHGEKVIDWSRKTAWVKENLVGQTKGISSTEGILEEVTGLHELQFIETRRHWFAEKVYHNTNGGVNVLNLVEGDQAIVESPAGEFEPFTVNYAETFIVPATVGEYTIRPSHCKEGSRAATLKAYVRT